MESGGDVCFETLNGTEEKLTTGWLGVGGGGEEGRVCVCVPCLCVGVCDPCLSACCGQGTGCCRRWEHNGKQDSELTERGRHPRWPRGGGVEDCFLEQRSEVYKGGFLGWSWGGGDPRSCLARTLGQGRGPTWPAECARGFRPQRGFFLSEISAHGVRCHQGFVTARAAPGLRGQKIWEALFL